MGAGPHGLARLNPLNQVFYLNKKVELEKHLFLFLCLNPLNQVFYLNGKVVFNSNSEARGLNPLNQVFYLNMQLRVCMIGIVIVSLNPLNQVFYLNVFDGRWATWPRVAES